MLGFQIACYNPRKRTRIRDYSGNDAKNLRNPRPVISIQGRGWFMLGGWFEGFQALP